MSGRKSVVFFIGGYCKRWRVDGKMTESGETWGEITSFMRNVRSTVRDGKRIGADA